MNKKIKQPIIFYTGFVGICCCCLFVVHEFRSLGNKMLSDNYYIPHITSPSCHGIKWKAAANIRSGRLHYTRPTRTNGTTSAFTKAALSHLSTYFWNLSPGHKHECYIYNNRNTQDPGCKSENTLFVSL